VETEQIGNEFAYKQLKVSYWKIIPEPC